MMDNRLYIIRNKKNCVNLSKAIERGYVYVKFDLNDGFTNGFVEDIYDNSFDLSDCEDERVIEISNEIYNDKPIQIREILFIMSYLHVEETYNYIFKKLMVYEAR